MMTNPPASVHPFYQSQHQEAPDLMYPANRHSRDSINQNALRSSAKSMFGFNARMFPLLGSVMATITILWTYLVAVTKSPPDVKPFPQTDITHTAIHYPEYVIFRIGMMVCPVLFAISFQILKNYLNAKSFEVLGQSEERLDSFGRLSAACCVLLCLSTSTISDGKDMNWTLHTIGASGFFVLAMYMCRVASRVYMKLYVKRHFCQWWSYQVKKYIDFVIAGFLLIQVIDSVGWVDVGSFIEWAATFYLILFFFTLYFDFADMSIMLERRKN